MNEEIKRIMKLVQEGKLSPEDATELIEAINDRKSTEDPTRAAVDSPFSRLIGSIENLTKDVSDNVKWNEIGTQIRESLNKGVDAIKTASESAAKSGGWSVFGQQAQKTVVLPLEISASQTLVFDGFSGSLIVEVGEPSVTIEATLRAFSEAEAHQAAERYTPVLETSDSNVTLRHGESEHLVAAVKVKVPEGTQIDIKRLSGDATLVGTKAKATVQVLSGNIVIDHAAGQVEATSLSGDVTIRNSTLNLLTVESKSGDVLIEDVSAMINVRSSSGDVTLKRCDGRTISVESASGSVHVDLVRPVSGSVNLRSMSGDLYLDIPDGCDARLLATTISGGVTVEALELQDRNDDRRKITGKLGKGNGSIDVSAVSGDVRVSLRDASAVKP